MPANRFNGNCDYGPSGTELSPFIGLKIKFRTEVPLVPYAKFDVQFAAIFNRYCGSTKRVFNLDSAMRTWFDPRDTGGRTGMGILQREYTPYCITHGIPQRDVWQIADGELDDLYRVQFWEPVRGDVLPPGLDLEMFDTAVNCGVGTAIARLQMALGVPVDRHLGAVTLGALQTADVAILITTFSDQRVRYYRQCRT